MAQIIGLPKLSPTMEEGVLVRWTKKEGDKVSPGDLVAEVETDKANMDFNIEDDGVLLKLLVKEGDTVKLGAPVAILGKAGEDVGALVEEAKKGGGGNGASAAPTPAPVAAEPAKKAEAKVAAEPAKKAEAKPAPKAEAKPAPQPSSPAESTGGKLLASPLAKSLAIELGVDLRTVKGTGPGGRIVERDVKDAAGGGGAAPQEAREDEAPEPEAPRESKAIAVRAPVPVAMPEGEYTDQPASNMRKRIAARLTEAN